MRRQTHKQGGCEMDQDLSKMLHERKEEDARAMPEMRQQVFMQDENSSLLPPMYEEFGHDSNSTASTTRDLEPTCVHTQPYPDCDQHQHKFYYLKPHYVHTAGYTVMDKYSGRWYDVSCTMCAIRRGRYSKRKRDWN